MKTLRPYQHAAIETIKQKLKYNKYPMLVNASVGAGKSLIIAEILLYLERAGMRCLCLTMNSILISQNCDTYNNQGGHGGVYCAGLDRKELNKNVIFASPHSVDSAIRRQRDISFERFNLIVIDESHNVNGEDSNSMYMRIINHYAIKSQNENYPFRVLGLTGTPFRNGNQYIVGDDRFFKEEIVTIPCIFLINEGYLVPYHVNFNPNLTFNMGEISLNKMGKFDTYDIEKVIKKDERLTHKIMLDIMNHVEMGRNGAFIFAATIRHAHECMHSLPPELSRIVTTETSHIVRNDILKKARTGEIKYLVSVGTLLTGVDVPFFDIVALLRPTESLVVLLQSIGRGLRLHPAKQSCLVLDYAENLVRHGDIDDPIIIDMIKSQSKEDEFVMPCFTCDTLNTIYARRCIGLVDVIDTATGEVLPKKQRCSHYFKFRECDNCKSKNDVVARECWNCKTELINPNDKLSFAKENIVATVEKATYWCALTSVQKIPAVYANYDTNQGRISEVYILKNSKIINIFYGRFVKKHIKNPKDWYIHLGDYSKLKDMLYGEILLTPDVLIVNESNKGYKIIKKYFTGVD